MSLEKNNYAIYIIAFLLVENSICYEEIFFPNSTADDFYCSPAFIDIEMTKQVTIFLPETHSDIYVKNCLLTKRSYDTAVVLLRGKEDPQTTCSNRTMIEYAHSNPNLVIVIHDLDEEIIHNPTTKSMMKSHLSILFVIITTRNSTYACDNGVFNEEVYNIIDHFLNEIWHTYEIFNVIVELPFVCPEYFVIYDDKRPSKYALYDRTIMTVAVNPLEDIKETFSQNYNLAEGYPLRVNIFSRFPTSITDCSKMHYYLNMDENYTHGLCGMDAFVMHDILRFHQFNTTFPEIINIDGYGYVDNNTITGSLGHLLKGEFDISFNSRFLVQYLNEDRIRFLHYVSFDAICAVLKTPGYVPLWHFVTYFLRPSTWGFLIGVLLLLSIMNKIFEKIRKITMEKESKSTDIIGLVSIGLFGCYCNKRLEVSILGGLCLFISVVVYSLFQGHVNFMYTTLVRYSKIETLEELHRSNIPIYTSPSFYKMLGTNLHQIKMSNVITTGDILKTDENIATLQRKFDVMLEIRLQYTDENGWPNMYLVRECYSNNFLSYIAKKSFPFSSEMKAFLMILLESGLPDAYYRLTQNTFGLAKTKTMYKPKSEPRSFMPTKVQEYRIPFGFLFVGYFISSITLVVERWWDKRTKKRLMMFSH